MNAGQTQGKRRRDFFFVLAKGWKGVGIVADALVGSFLGRVLWW
jgi:hypothetical protein